MRIVICCVVTTKRGARPCFPAFPPLCFPAGLTRVTSSPRVPRRTSPAVVPRAFLCLVLLGRFSLDFFRFHIRGVSSGRPSCVTQTAEEPRAGATARDECSDEIFAMSRRCLEWQDLAGPGNSRHAPCVRVASDSAHTHGISLPPLSRLPPCLRTFTPGIGAYHLLKAGMGKVTHWVEESSDSFQLLASA